MDTLTAVSENKATRIEVKIEKPKRMNRSEK